MLTRLARHAAAAGVRRLPRLTQSPRLLVPVTTSVRHPMIVLPMSWREWSAAKIDAVLAHEMAHIARQDTLTQRMSLVYRAAFWPNPFSWWLHRRIAALAEQVSDEAALGAGIDRATYAEALVGFFAEHSREAGRRAVWHVAMARGGSASAEERVERVLAWERGRSAAVTRTMAVIIGLAAAPVMLLASAVQPEPVRATALDLPAPVAMSRPAPASDPRPLAVPQQATPVLRPGNGVTNPVPIKRADPKYTEEARLAGIQGEVDLDVVVLSNGTVGDVRITKSLEAGLDAQAILSAKQWLFKPAMKDGTPVNMIVGLAIEFKLPGAPAAAPVVIPGAVDSHDKPFYFFNYSPNAQGIVPPKPIKQASPKYTSEAMRAKIQGDVDVEIIVQKDGTVGDVRVTKSLDPDLDEAAITAARQWRFQPATKNGEPVEYTCTLSLEFRIHDGPPIVYPPKAEAYPPDTPGLVAPVATKRVDPKYTSDAMRAKIQGTVELDVVVQADGTIGDVRITKSLDTQFGLDQEAIAAVKGYTFTAATLNGSPVAAIVKLMVEFRLH
jgi:TonB family protein